MHRAVPTDREDIEHLLRRTGFAAPEHRVNALVALDWVDAVDAVLDLTAAPDPDAGLPAVTRAPDDPADWWGEYVSIVHRWHGRCVSTPTPIIEKMVLFWHGYLTSSVSAARLGLILDQHQLFRRSGLGRFDDLVTSVAVDPAMLRYLDGDNSHRSNPNENFPRELLELFTLGVGNYSEDDVRAAARAFTGYRVGWPNEDYVFDASWHDDGDKTFMGVTRNWDGPQIIDHVLNGPTRMVAARHLVRRLWTFLAHPDPAADLVEALATVFSNADLQIMPLVRAMLLRPEFRSTTCKRGLIRSPMELSVAVSAQLGLPASMLNPEWFLEGMGQRLFSPPNVDGWPTNEGWMSTATYWGKHRFADYIGHRGSSAGLLGGSESRTPDDAAMEALRLFGVTSPSQATRQTLASFVTETRASQAWAERRGLLTLTFLSPEFALA